ncbi:acyltransferase [Sandarakinorhabdus cyanobacteriorum]|nr:acyltransferase [Sandarakinorhabdus cyanobacteriorum]
MKKAEAIGGMMARRKSFKQMIQAQVRKHLWKMDVHPSAWIAETALIDRTWPKGIHIAADVMIGEEVVVLTHDLTRGIYLDTYVGPRSQVGARAIILPGITVGADCVIQPGALVNRDVPDGHVAEGNPAVSRPR